MKNINISLVYTFKFVKQLLFCENALDTEDSLTVAYETKHNHIIQQLHTLGIYSLQFKIDVRTEICT